MREGCANAPQVDAGFRPKLCVHVLAREGYDFLVLVDRDKPAWASVSDSSGDFVELADGDRTVEEIAAHVAKKFEEDRGPVLEDALSFYQDLADAGFFEKPDARQTPPVKSLFMHLTNACNLSCLHCYIAAGPGQWNHMDTGLAKRYIEELASMDYGGSVVLSGGEPLLHPDFTDLVQTIGQRLTVSLLTNGTLVTPGTAKLFTDKNCHLQVSLDGSTAKVHDAIRGRGSFEKALRAIRIFQDHGLSQKINISTVLQEGNTQDLENIACLVHELGVPFLRVLPMRMEGRAITTFKSNKNIPGLEEQIAWYNKALFALPKKYPGLKISPGISGLVMNLSHLDYPMAWCSLGRTLVINTDGSLGPCPLFHHSQYALGNAQETCLAKINADPKRAELIHLLVTGRRDRLAECDDCPWKQFCQSGCPGMALIHYETTEQVDGFCQYRKEMYEKLVFELSDQPEIHSGLLPYDGM